ncbi:hypothetical protein GOC03_23175 [Sinorhizobium meliloti]|uniref:hypothetical protein n=1 Tax=Rhizobium meliloti TaxID=382 RepID=UPI0029B683A8|nr:hypothetical protein [Sinorhizobium meliloti]MDX0022197.1 hypothetical protein [Sinorhizobium meliloti]MDX0234840.1 hypothetical protein [Sinorhizobium meliloti]
MLPVVVCLRLFRLRECRDDDAPSGRGNLVLYFENEVLDASIQAYRGACRPHSRGQAQFWGQRVFRFFDPDGTVIAWAKKVSSVLTPSRTRKPPDATT